MDKRAWFGAALAAAILILPLPVFAQQSDSAATGMSGYVEKTPPLEGADGVGADLQVDDLDLGALLRIPKLKGALDPWWKAKRYLNQKLGLQLQVSYQSLRQWADESQGEDSAAAGRFELQGMWTLLGRKTENPGLVSFRGEYRDTLGADIPPTQLGRQFGSLGLVGAGFSDFRGALTELAWRQTVLDGRMKFGFGKISATSWYNGHSLSAPKRGYQNSSLHSSNAKPLPGRGIGFVAGFRLGERFAMLAGIHDANARSADNPFDTIDEGEFYQSVEVRWFPTTFERHRWDQVRLQIWHQDERTEAGVPSSQGVTVALSRLFKDRFMPWFLGGISDGDASQMEADLAAGVAFAFNTAHRAARDVLGFGFSWGRPSNSAFRDQYTWELFYRFQLVQHIAITPSVQLIVDPATSTASDDVWVGGLRLRITF